MAKRVSKRNKVDEPIINSEVTQPEVVPVSEPQSASFDVTFFEVKNGQIALTKEQYERIRLLMMRESAKTFMSDTMLERLNSEWATKEYQAGSHAIESTLKWLWDKFIAGKIKDQLVANVIFQVLVKGVEEAFQAFKNWLHSKNAGIADDLETAIETAGELIESGKVVDFKNEIEAHIEDVKRRNEADQASGKKVGFFKKLINVIKSIFS